MTDADRHLTRPDSEGPEAPEGRSKPELLYFGIVSVLLVLILGALAVLWVRERNAHRRLSDQYLRDRVLWEQANQKLGATLQQQAMRLQGRVEPLAPDEAIGGSATIDGRPRGVLTISPAVGRRLGLAPGTVLIVAEPSAPEAGGGAPAPGTPQPGPDPTPDADATER